MILIANSTVNHLWRRQWTTSRQSGSIVSALCAMNFCQHSCHYQLQSCNSPLEWPNIDMQPINKFHTLHLAKVLFPTLFPYGTGHPTTPGRQCPVSLTDGFKHLIRYGEISADGVKCSCFAWPPTFFWIISSVDNYWPEFEKAILPEDQQEKTEFSKPGKIQHFLKAIRTHSSAEGNQTVSFSIETVWHTFIHQLLISNAELLLYL